MSRVALFLFLALILSVAHQAHACNCAHHPSYCTCTQCDEEPPPPVGPPEPPAPPVEPPDEPTEPPTKPPVEPPDEPEDPPQKPAKPPQNPDTQPPTVHEKEVTRERRRDVDDLVRDTRDQVDIDLRDAEGSRPVGYSFRTGSDFSQRLLAIGEAVAADTTRTRQRNCQQVLRYRDFDVNIRYDDSGLTYRVFPQHLTSEGSMSSGSGRSTTTTMGGEAGLKVDLETHGVGGHLGANAGLSTERTSSSSTDTKISVNTVAKRYIVRVTGQVKLWTEYVFHETWMWEGYCPGVVNPRSDSEYSVKGPEATSNVDNTYTFVIYDSNPKFDEINDTVIAENARYRFRKAVDEGAWSTDNLPRPSPDELPSPSQVGVH